MEIKNFRDLELKDHFMFQEVLSDKEICRELLEEILQFDIKEITFIESEAYMKPQFAAKGIRADVLAADEKGSRYVVEIQNSRFGDLPKRIRYYQGCLDLSVLQSGEYYDKLTKSVIIFICTDDPFESGLHKYSFSMKCNEDNSVEYDDETQIIVLNSKGTRMDDVDPGLLEFLNFMENPGENSTGAAHGELVTRIAARMDDVRSSEEKERNYMMYETDMYIRIADARDEARAEGMAQGRVQGMAQGMAQGASSARHEDAAKMKADGLPVAKIAQYTGLPEKEIENL